MKKKRLLIDSDVMINLLENGNNYLNNGKTRSLYLSFDKVFKSVTKGYFFNTDAIYDFAKNRDNPEYLDKLNPVYIKRMQDIIAQNNQGWEKLDDIVEGDWSVLFTNQTLKTKSKYRAVRDLAKERMNHYITTDNIFDNNSDFTKSIDYDSLNTVIQKGYDYSQDQIFRGFSHPSPYYICYDQYLFQSISFLGGESNSASSKRFKEGLIKYISLYCTWAYECALKKEELPYIFFGGYSFLSLKNQKIQQDFKLKIFEFLNFIERKEKHKNIDVVKNFIKQNKIHFFDLNLSDYNNHKHGKYERLTHNNYALVNYGGLRWTERKNLFMQTKGDSPIFYVKKTDKNGKIINKNFNLYRAYKDDTIIYKTFFKDDISRLEYQEKNLIELIYKSTGIKIKEDGSIRINTN